tara:strand:+ start:218 stop:3259 length:3042 start_codon:yes stop_codon:yes gene_type:complete
MNKSVKLLIALFLVTLSGSALLAQKTQVYTNTLQDFEKAKMLFTKKQYNPSIKLFESFKDESNHHNLNFECDLYIALSRLKLEKQLASTRLASLISLKPDHNLSDEIYFELGLYYFDKERFKKCVNYFEKISEINLNKEKREEYIFKKGYSLFQIKEFKLAKNQFKKIMNSDGEYAIEANYYYGYQCYILKDYTCALATFTKIGDKGPKTMQLYMAQIYYENQTYDKAFEIVQKIVLSKKQNEIELLRGKIQYQLGNKNIALGHFEKYSGDILSLESDELYQFADAYYLANKFKKALQFYILLANEETEIGQLSNYYIGLIDVKSNQKERALNAFAEASRKKFNPIVSEISAFNYAKLASELNKNNVAINSINFFIKSYPQSTYTDEAKSLLADVFLNTKNYKAAIKLLEEIPNINLRSKEAYQKITFHRAEELYHNKEYDKADVYFKKSHKYPVNKTLEGLAYFWRAEISAKSGDYTNSVNLMNRFMSYDEISLYKNYGYYSIGYSYFKMKDYPKAQIFFSKFKNKETYNAENNKLYLDNTQRLADCYFINGAYSRAISEYGFIIKNNYQNSDYAIFQQGMLYGLKERHLDKISTLRKIQKDFPNSIYIDDALYQMAIEHLTIEDYKTADRIFNLIISQHDYSPFLPTSYLKLGLINYNQNKDEIALRYYKTVVERFPKTSPSREALSFIEIIHNNQGNPQAYFDYIKNIPGAEVRITAQDSVIYQNAMRIYSTEDYKAASLELGNYINRFGEKGFFILQANYYKAECDFYTDKEDEALTHYQYVVDQSRNEFTEKSLIKLSNTYYNRKKYEQAIIYFKKLEPIAASKSTYLNTILGQMRSHEFLSNFELAKANAIQLLPIENVPVENLVEANMLLGRVQLQDSNYLSAKFHFDYIIDNSRNEMTAEALYNRAFIQLLDKKIESSRADVYRLNDDFSAYEYWVVKGFIILSDIYLLEEDLFQAKATLQSIIDNYFIEEDGLLDICKTKLASIEVLENTTYEKDIPIDIETTE